MTGAGIREHAATLIVAALSSLFAATLILGTGVLTAALDPELVESSGSFRLVLLMVSFIFIVIALYVGAVVTANTFATIIAGRTRTIALLRLIGSTASRVRSRAAAEGLLMGTIGAVVGLVFATLFMGAVVTWGPALGWLPDGQSYPRFDPLALMAAGVVALTTWIAAWSGSRRVGQVSPIAATGATVEVRPEEARRRTGRTVWAWLLGVTGAGLIALGLLLGLITPLALLVSFFGGLLSFTGIVIGAHLVMPPLLHLAGKLTGRGATGALAAANAVRSPGRSSRSTIGLVVGVTLVTMFAVALDSYRTMTLLAFEYNPSLADKLDSTLAVTTAIFTGLVGFSAVIAAVGLVNTLSLSVLQRTRELGLLRALGLTAGQVKRMVVAESAQLTLAALGFGLVLGIFYGWVAAQSLLGSQVGFALPTVPLPVVTGIVLFGILLAAIASAAPARRATRVSPVVALAVG